MGFYLILFFLIIFKRQNMAFLSDSEQKISNALMEALSIRHRILLEEPNFELRNLEIFKHQTLWNRATAYLNTLQILKYFRMKTFPAPPTLIIFKVENLKNVVTLSKKLTKVI